MKKICHLVFLCLFVALTSSSCGYVVGDAVRGDAYTTSEHMRVQNVKYRRGGSHRAFLGAIGVVGGQDKNMFELRDSSPKELNGLEVCQVASVGVSAEESAGNDANTKVVNNGKLNLSFKKKISEKGSFDIFQIFDAEEVADRLNSEKNEELLKELAKSNDYRIVTSIIVLSNHKKFRRISDDSNVSLRLLNRQGHSRPLLDVITRNRHRRVIRIEKIPFSDGMIIGYEYSRLCWEKFKDGWKVADLMVDQPGDATYCPDGSTSDIESALSDKK